MFFRFIFFLLFLILLGCVPYGEEQECFDVDRFVSLNFLTTDNIDSIHFYLNNQQVCYGNMGSFHETLICKKSSENEYLSAEKVGENVGQCDTSANEPIWKGFHCFLGKPSDKIKIDSFNIDLKIYNPEGSAKIKIAQILSGGNIINIVSDRDSLQWFGYDDNPIRPFFDEFNSPSSSKRMGCFDGYCVATLPMVEKEVCYDK